MSDGGVRDAGGRGLGIDVQLSISISQLLAPSPTLSPLPLPQIKTHCRHSAIREGRGGLVAAALW